MAKDRRNYLKPTPPVRPLNFYPSINKCIFTLELNRNECEEASLSPLLKASALKSCHVHSNVALE